MKYEPKTYGTKRHLLEKKNTNILPQTDRSIRTTNTGLTQSTKITHVHSGTKAVPKDVQRHADAIPKIREIRETAKKVASENKVAEKPAVAAALHSAPQLTHPTKKTNISKDEPVTHRFRGSVKHVYKDQYKELKERQERLLERGSIRKLKGEDRAKDTSKEELPSPLRCDKTRDATGDRDRGLHTDRTDKAPTERLSNSDPNKLMKKEVKKPSRLKRTLTKKELKKRDKVDEKQANDRLEDGVTPSPIRLSVVQNGVLQPMCRNSETKNSGRIIYPITSLNNGVVSLNSGGGKVVEGAVTDRPAAAPVAATAATALPSPKSASETTSIVAPSPTSLATVNPSHEAHRTEEHYVRNLEEKGGNKRKTSDRKSIVYKIQNDYNAKEGGTRKLPKIVPPNFISAFTPASRTPPDAAAVSQADTPQHQNVTKTETPLHHNAAEKQNNCIPSFHFSPELPPAKVSTRVSPRTYCRPIVATSGSLVSGNRWVPPTASLHKNNVMSSVNGNSNLVYVAKQWAGASPPLPASNYVKNVVDSKVKYVNPDIPNHLLTPRFERKLSDIKSSYLYNEASPHAHLPGTHILHFRQTHMDRAPFPTANWQNQS
eukprot:Platyproteum_vivax@DN3306_c0_g1_i1.p1